MSDAGMDLMAKARLASARLAAAEQAAALRALLMPEDEDG